MGGLKISKFEYADVGEPIRDGFEGCLLSSDRDTLLPELDLAVTAGRSTRLSRGDILSFPLRQLGRPRDSSKPAEGAKEVMEDTLVAFVENEMVEGMLPPVC